MEIRVFIIVSLLVLVYARLFCRIMLWDRRNWENLWRMPWLYIYCVK